jgi:hypothetical protein|tara:strand:- start:2603 stop:2788 length:186 start_codon:yes stop_codon:yes gene_type:complete
MKQNKNYFSNGNKQLVKEALAVLGFMLFLSAVGFGLAWYKGHTVWQPYIEESRLIKTWPWE